MNITILSINYAPELVGVAPYSAGMAEWLVGAGHQVTVVCAQPYYPQWRVDPAYANPGPVATVERGVRVVRLPCYVPAVPDGKRRIAHHFSFLRRAIPAMVREARRSAPDVVIAVAPSLISTIAARRVVRRTGAKYWLHIQDFEVEAAFATGLLSGDGPLGRAARMFERWALDADVVSTISPQMCARLRSKGIADNKIVEFRNWADIDQIQPLPGPSPYRERWGIDRPHVALYSGNVANKQGIEIVVEAARRLRDRRDIQFVVCGTGPNREKLVASAADLDNIQFHDLQPREELPNLLGLATVHLLPQIAGAADLVLPSKLTNMLASGRAIVATAEPGSGIADEVAGCGLVCAAGNPASFADAIAAIADSPSDQVAMGAAARQRALDRWSKPQVLAVLLDKLRQLAD